MEKELLNYLENTFHIKFYIKKTISNYEEYEIKIENEFKDMFIVKLIINKDIRLSMICEPDIFGNKFVQNINSSTEYQRNNFIKFWDLLGEEYIEIQINNQIISQDNFLNDKTKWKKFYLKYTKQNFLLNKGEENNKDYILKYLSNFISMILSIMTYEIDGINGYNEGKEYIDISKRYERNPINRQLCLNYKGYTCSVCGMNFKNFYGEIGKNFIEVHHMTMVSDMGDNYKVDPLKEMFPVCPNCHAMLHKKTPPYTIDELKNIIANNK